MRAGKAPKSTTREAAVILSKEGLFYLYDACEDDPKEIEQCPWQAKLDFGGEALVEKQEVETAPAAFLSPGNHGVGDAEAAEAPYMPENLANFFTTTFLQ